MTYPEHVRWAVDRLDVRPDDRLLEIGPGSGIAVALICPRLVTGSVVAIDRSATAVARTRRRNASFVEDGRADVRQASFTLADLATVGLAGRTFDKIFSVNVNLFWTGPARAELELIRDLLVPGGAMYACWGRGPTPGRSTEIARRVRATFAGAGFTTVVTADDGLQCVTART